ncbi:MAG: carbohydrate kinase family protein [Anaerolineae bacterium]|nr:carbohydrate kinase family protein [Anaerolineae bacterium]
MFAADLLAKGRRVSLEPFKPPDRPLSDNELRAILTACEIFSPNWYEAARLVRTDDDRAMVARFRDLGCRVLALRRGGRGADVWDLVEGRGVHVPAVQTAVVDTVGAGNAFCGALVAAWDAGIEEAACRASAAASYLIEQVGLPDAPPEPDHFARRLDEARRGMVALSLA